MLIVVHWIDVVFSIILSLTCVQCRLGVGLGFLGEQLLLLDRRILRGLRSIRLLWLLLLSRLILFLLLLFNPLLVPLTYLFNIFLLVLLRHLLRLKNIWAHTLSFGMTSSFALRWRPCELILIACLLSALAHSIQSSHHRVFDVTCAIWHRFISWLLQNLGKFLLVLAQMRLLHCSGFGEVHLGFVGRRSVVKILLRWLLLLLLHGELAWIDSGLLDFQYAWFVVDCWLRGLVVVKEGLCGATHLINGHRCRIRRLLFQIQLGLLARQVLALLRLLRHLRLTQHVGDIRWIWLLPLMVESCIQCCTVINSGRGLLGLIAG